MDWQEKLRGVAGYTGKMDLRSLIDNCPCTWRGAGKFDDDYPFTLSAVVDGPSRISGWVAEYGFEVSPSPRGYGASPEEAVAYLILEPFLHVQQGG